MLSRIKLVTLRVGSRGSDIKGIGSRVPPREPQRKRAQSSLQDNLVRTSETGYFNATRDSQRPSGNAGPFLLLTARNPFVSGPAESSKQFDFFHYRKGLF
jgi:hypothetical protein